MSAKLKVSNWRRRRVAGAMNGRRRRNHHRRDDFVVEGVQDMGRELGQKFNNLRRRCKARKLVAAIRHCDHRAVNELFDWHCRSIHFYKRPGYDCVRICCSFNRGAVVVSFDICVRSLYNGYGNGFYGNGYNGNGFF